ncbi:MAG: glycosyltransferase [Desulfuromonadales bacterium]|nr:glycosyltransferase [Desulfuromonadales bacterium]
MLEKGKSLVSVILCNYNYDQYVGDSINSILRQTHENLQLVVVDDGSTDNSREIINTFVDSRIVKIFQKNSGQAAAFNAGYERCTGEFIGFLDSDDFWDNDKLSSALPFFDDENICMVQHNLRVVDRGSNDTGRLQTKVKPGLTDVFSKYFRKNHTGFFVATSGIVCRKSVLDKIFPLDVDWKICADVAFTRALPLFGKIYTISETLGSYRIHGENNWVNTQQQNQWLINQRKYVDYTNHCLKKHGYQQQLVFEKSGMYRRNVLKNKIPGLRSFCDFLLR